MKKALLLLLFPLQLLAQTDDPIKPVWVDELHAPIIDGVLSDSVWANMKPIDDFQTFYPDWGMQYDYKTEVFTAYDDQNIYFAFNCYGDPKEIKTSIAARDNIRADDWICINLDSYNDQQSLYGLYVNPNGIQMDTRFASQEEDLGVDIIWYSAGKIHDKGYTIEAKIPFKSIRYTKQNGDVSMGVIFERRISKEAIQCSYPPLDPDMGFNFLIQMQEMKYEKVKRNTVLELLPFVTYSDNDSHSGGTMQNTPGRVDAGITGKVGITSDMILDLTYNPDFSQVESDARQVDDNQRFAIFYPERRPFFMEGSENFNFSAINNIGVRSVVNTRTIVNPIFSSKLSGKLGQKNRIAAIYAQDELTPDNVKFKRFAEFSVLRYRRAFGNDSYVGGIYTSRVEENSFNRIVGADGNFRLNDKSKVAAHYLSSFDRALDSEDVYHNYAYTGTYEYQTRNFDFSPYFIDVSEGFFSEVGFMGRTGVTSFGFSANPKIYFSRKYFQRIDNRFTISQTFDKPGKMWEKEYAYSFTGRWVRNTSLTIGGSFTDEIYLAERFNRNSLTVRAQSQVNRRVFFFASMNTGNSVRFTDQPYTGNASSASGRVNLQLTDNFNSEWLYNYSDFIRDSDGKLDFERTILRSKNTYQVNKYLFFRIIAQYDSGRPEIAIDYLASFTFIPGTVIHLGYGSLYNKNEWDSIERFYYPTSDRYSSFRRGVFFKASYLWRK